MGGMRKKGRNDIKEGNGGVEMRTGKAGGVEGRGKMREEWDVLAISGIRSGASGALNGREGDGWQRTLE